VRAAASFFFAGGKEMDASGDNSKDWKTGFSSSLSAIVCSMPKSWHRRILATIVTTADEPWISHMGSIFRQDQHNEFGCWALGGGLRSKRGQEFRPN